jgi:polar amino acid transport system substrate-binding protein
MSRKPLLSAAAIAAASLLLAGCGGGTPSGSETAAPTSDRPAPYDVSAIETDEEIAALVPEDVASDGTLMVAVAANYAPAEFLAEDGSTVIGFDADYAAALAKVMGLEAQFHNGAFAQLIPGIGTQTEVGISSFTVNAERLETIDMVTYFEAGASFATRSGNPAGVDPANLCGVSVAVQTGTFQETDDLPALNEECAAAGEDPIEVLSYASQAEASTNTAGGKADVMYADSPIVNYALVTSGGALEQVGEVQGSAPQGVVVSKDDPELSEAVRAATQKLLDDGTMEEIFGAWGNAEGLVETSEINPAV